MTHGADQRLLRLLEAYAGLRLKHIFTILAPRTQSIYSLHRDAIVLSSRSNNDDDDGGDRDDGDDGDDGDGDGDGNGDGDGDGEEQIPQLYIYKLSINCPSGCILVVVLPSYPYYL